MKSMTRMKSIARGIRSAGYLLPISVPAQALLGIIIVIDVVGRELFGTGFVGTYNLVGLLLVVVTFCGVADSWRKGEFINIELIKRRFNKRGRLILDVVTVAIGLGCCGVLVWLGAKMVIISFTDGSVTPGLHIPEWPFRLAIPIGASILCLEMIARLVVMVRHFRNKEEVAS